MTPALTAALTAIAAARQVLRARTPGTPAGDADEEHEDNTFNLPEGRPIRRAFKRFAKRQLKKTLSSLPQIGAPLPAAFKPLTDWTQPMAGAMTPLVGLYWDEAGQTTRARLGLDPDQWEVHDPHLHDQIRQQAFRFCESTNETTDKELNSALEQLRQEFVEGLVTEGESIPQLTARVKSVFGRLSDVRAEQIARTEAARAVHQASLISAKESGVVSGKKWLLSGDACEYCQAVAAKFPGGTGLDSDFHNDGRGTDYSACTAPPLHPNCRCSITYVLTDEYEQLLAEHGPPEPERYDYDGGSLGPEPKRRKIGKPDKTQLEKDIAELEKQKPPQPDVLGNVEYQFNPQKPAPPPVPQKPATQWGIPFEPTKPIGDRIRQSAAWQRIQELAALPTREDLDEELRAARKVKQDWATSKEGAELSKNDGKAYLAKYKEFDDRAEQLLDRTLKARRAGDEKARDIMRPPDGAKPIEWTHDEKVKTPSVSKAIHEAKDWLGGTIAPHNAMDFASVKWRECGTFDRQRAYYNPILKHIKLAKSNEAPVAIHEWGHVLEAKIPGIHSAALEFLEHRVGNEKPQKLNEVLKDHAYEKWETGRKDDFEKVFGRNAWYVGKDYGKKATEIVSMGLEQFYRDPLNFARKDPEYAAFLLGILDGSLRSP